jgi:uncharacterized protein
MKYIYLHGFASSPKSFKAQYLKTELARLGIELEVPDLNLGDFSTITLSKQLVFLQDRYGDSDLAIAGSSLGGYLATLFAAVNPRIQNLFLLAPAFNFGKHFCDFLGEAAISEWKEGGTRPFEHYGQKQKVELHYQFLADAISLSWIQPPDLPILILHGKQDLVVSSELSEEFALGRENTKLEILETDHGMTNQIEYISEKMQSFWQISY